MRFFTHSYVITIYEDGKFCWKNKGWVKDEDNAANEGLFLALILYAVLIMVFN